MTLGEMLQLADDGLQIEVVNQNKGSLRGSADTLLENLRNELLRGTVEGVGMRGGAVLLWVEEEKN